MKKQKDLLHPEYLQFVPYWKQIRTFVRGMNDVKEYIQSVTSDTSTKGRKRNKDYKDRAIYVNFPMRTRNALHGAVFRKNPEIELPAQIDFLLSDVNGADLSIEHLAKSCVANVLEVGRHGLFVDYGDRAKIVEYTAENVSYWETNEKGVLSLVKILTGGETYKLLKIGIDGYYIEKYEKDELLETIEPKKFDGSRFDYIPFVFVGSVNNSPDVDEMPLWPIVDITRGHLQNSADLEDLARYLIPTPAVTVPNRSWLEEMLPNGIYTFGDGSIIPLPEGGSASLLQANENQMHSKLMEQKEDQLIKIGARLISGNNTNRTAEEAKIMYSSENSMLDTIAGNTSEAIKWCLEVCNEFMSATQDEIVFKLNREFFDSSINPQLVAQSILMLDRGIVATKDVRGYLRKSGFIEADRTDEDIDGEIEAQAL